MINRRKSRVVYVGNVPVGGENPVTVQTMVKCPTVDTEEVLKQIRKVAILGCDMVRVAVPSKESLDSFKNICESSPLPVIADIHFDYLLAIEAIKRGAKGIRINPGNISDRKKIEAIVDVAGENNVCIRIGVNSGSLENMLKRGKFYATAEMLAESALKWAEFIENRGFHAIKISVKSTDFAQTVKAYQIVAEKSDYPLHLGLTESGGGVAGIVYSTVTISHLLLQGIGDTIRVSLSDSPEVEVKVGLEILKCLGLRNKGWRIISCPACARVSIDVKGISYKIEKRMEKMFYDRRNITGPVVAVMGCIVNGPGEARQADIAVAGGGKGRAVLYRDGKLVKRINEGEIVDSIIEMVKLWYED